MNSALDRDEPGKVAAGVMAVVVHLAFFALLVVGVSWQRRPPEAVVVELWNNLPSVPPAKTQPKPPPPEPKLEISPPPPKPPVVKPEPKPEPKAAPKPTPEPKAKPDIAIDKEKQEKAKRQEREKAEQKKREEQAKLDKQREEREKAEQKKREAAQEKARRDEIAELKKKQDEAVQRLARENEAKRVAEIAAQNKAVDEYIGRIRNKIRPFVNKEPCIALGNPEIVFIAVLLPDGNLLNPPRIRRSSGSAACDDSVLRAVMRAQPLPLPADPALFARFRELELQFRPND